MRRKDKEINDPLEIEKIIRECQVCHLAMIDGGTPYVVPLSFGYEGDSLYFHSARKGRKIDALQKNPSVCFEFDLPGALIEDEKACKWSVKYQSVIGFGNAEFLDDPDLKREAFRIIMAHYSENSFELSDDDLRAVAIFMVRISEISAKQSGI